ncbi:MAG: ClpXP protease specificity-enhancing factor SspB [Deferribacterales bacterium]
MDSLILFKKELIKNVTANYLKFFMHISPHPGVVIGRRGLVDEEKTRGIVLVFGPQSYRDFRIEDSFISVTMKFSGRWEEVFIPFESVAAIFNDPVSPEFIVNFRIPETKTEQPKDESGTQAEGKIIRHDFGKKK